MENNLQNDQAFDKILEITKLDRNISEDFVNKTIELLKNELSNNKDFNIKHGFLGLSKCIVALAQTLCESEEEYNSEISKAQGIAINKVMNAIMPKTKDGKIIEEGYDMEDLSIKRLMLVAGTVIDYIFWRTEFSHYSETREELEKSESEKTKLEDEE